MKFCYVQIFNSHGIAFGLPILYTICSTFVSILRLPLNDSMALDCKIRTEESIPNFTYVGIHTMKLCYVQNFSSHGIGT